VARAESSRWHAIHVRARFERVVALRLQDKDMHQIRDARNLIVWEALPITGN